MPIEVVLPEAPANEGSSSGAPAVWILVGPRAEGCQRWGEETPQQLLRQLRAVVPSARLFCMDLAGAGRQRAEASPAHVPLLLDNLRARWAAAGMSGVRIGLLGFSLGALVATEWARRHPEEVAALVLLNPAMRPFTQIVRATPFGLWPRALKTLLARDVSSAHGRATVTTALRHGLARWRYATSKRRPIHHVLLLAGQGDPWRDWRVAQRISRAWGAALRMHPQAGHDLLQDDPMWVAKAVSEWLVALRHPPTPR